MDEKDWDVLLTVYEEKNVTRAAQKLHITQPGLTYRLHQLEEQFNVQIFVRGKTMINFTKAGELLVRYSKRMKVERQKLQDQLFNIKEDVGGVLRIGASSNFAHYELPNILKSFHDLYPKIQFKIHSGWGIHVLERMTNEKDHVCIIRGDYKWHDRKLYLNEDPMCLVSRNHISLEELPYLPRILISLAADTKKIEEQWWQERFSLPPNICMEVDKVETCKEMVLKGLGYGILPQYLIKEEDLFVQPLTYLDGKPFTRKLCALY
ncbi:LysR family transcriptional regulator, partial [Bacillaceae bacterium Marseille-Q3522]|nr:LysR family transcriptional regulator [Bacillaceae bacterium Marseille-Q3522]